MTLYYSPGAVSMTVHILLRELERPFELVRVPTGDDAHLQSAYLSVNPVGRIPALQVDGKVLTEVPAILSYLARGTSWLPEGGWVRARCDEVLSRIVSLAHPSFRMAVRPDRVLSSDASPDALAAAQDAGRRDFVRALGHVEQSVEDEGWALGTEHPTIADIYVAVLTSWGRFIGESMDGMPRLRRISKAILTRPSARAVFVVEGLVDAEGRPTPPARV